jgi:hypothetical protein
LLYFIFSTWGRITLFLNCATLCKCKVLDFARPYILFYGCFYTIYRAPPCGAFILSPFHIPKKRSALFFFCRTRDIYFFHFNPLSLASPPNSALALSSTSGAVVLTFSALLNFERVLCTHTKDFICKAFQESAHAASVCDEREKEREFLIFRLY